MWMRDSMTAASHVARIAATSAPVISRHGSRKIFDSAIPWFPFIRHLKPPLATLDILALPAFHGAFDGSHGAAEHSFKVGVERGLGVFSNKVHADTHILSATAVRATHWKNDRSKHAVQSLKKAAIIRLPMMHPTAVLMRVLVTISISSGHVASGM